MLLDHTVDEPTGHARNIVARANPTANHNLVASPSEKRIDRCRRLQARRAPVSTQASLAKRVTRKGPWVLIPRPPLSVWPGHGAGGGAARWRAKLANWQVLTQLLTLTPFN